MSSAHKTLKNALKIKQAQLNDKTRKEEALKKMNKAQNAKYSHLSKAAKAKIDAERHQKAAMAKKLKQSGKAIKSAKKSVASMAKHNDRLVGKMAHKLSKKVAEAAAAKAKLAHEKYSKD
jgi:hypothetical protein